MAISDMLCVHQELSWEHNEAFFFLASLVIIVTLGIEGNGVICLYWILHQLLDLL